MVLRVHTGSVLWLFGYDLWILVMHGGHEAGGPALTRHLDRHFAQPRAAPNTVGSFCLRRSRPRTNPRAAQAYSIDMDGAARAHALEP